MRSFALLATALVGCSSPPDLALVVDAAGARRGAVKRVERVGGQPGWLAKTFVWWAGMSERLPVEHGTTLYRVEYWTVDPTGDSIPASGLVALPRASALRGVVSWQHGTTVERTEVPSKPTPDEGVVAALAFAGHGYLLSFPRALEGEAESSSLYLAYLVASYARVYEEPLGSVLTQPYASTVEDLFDGEHAGEAVVEALPRDPRQMFEPAFLADFEAGRPTWLGDRLRENDLVAFEPRAPVRAWFDELAGDESSRRP